MGANGYSRRNFLQRSSLAASELVIGSTKGVRADEPVKKVAPVDRLPREVWVASIAQDRMEGRNYKEMIGKMLGRMKEVVVYEPDIICLPEVFPFVNLASGRPPLAEVAEEPIGPISQRFADFAREHNCYVICPIYTKHGGKYYNSAVVLDRQGKMLGKYDKSRPTEGEMDKGIVPGAAKPPVFQTDFGVIGVQICFDINWPIGWRQLGQAGAEMVFWPSAFPGSRSSTLQLIPSCDRKSASEGPA